MPDRQRGSSGFTLIEVLVALSVVGLALGAAIRTTGSSIASHDYSRTSTLASWVAMDLRTDLMLSDTPPREAPFVVTQWGQQFQGVFRRLDDESDSSDEAPWEAWEIEVGVPGRPEFPAVVLVVERGRFQ